VTHQAHTVEKIGGTSMTRTQELLDSLFLNGGEDPYNRIFVVSAYGGITNLLLEHKKTGEAGVYSHFANNESGHSWSEALNTVATAMRAAHAEILDDGADVAEADDFVRERIEGARSCLIDLQRLCSYGHFRLSKHMLVIREMLSGLGESHSAFVTALLLRRKGVNARCVDLGGWRDEEELTLEERIAKGLDHIDFARELPIVTGYAQCSEGLMKVYDRGYSEVTFSQIAAQTGAREAIIHKEFHLSSADPKLVGVEAVRKLGHTNYDVADQLSNMGMEAIHPSAAKTLRQSGIPLRVTNAFDPGDPGTLIDEQPSETPHAEIICGLDVLALEVFEQDMVGVKGYDAAILETLTRHKTYICAKSSNANTITHYLNTTLKQVRRAEQDLSERFPNASVTTRSLAVISVIGRDLSGLGCLGRGLGALAAEGIEPIAVLQGSRPVDIQMIVQREQADTAIKALHRTLIEGKSLQGEDVSNAEATDNVAQFAA
tara:strand:+ start:1055 stop:2521 length:1467 start_codon:yes stop_codon:yes gene_type:complete